MNGYRAVLKSKDDDPTAQPRKGPMDTIWYKGKDKAKAAGERLNKEYHGGKYRVVVEARDVDAYAVTWWNYLTSGPVQDMVLAPQIGSAHQLATRYLESRVGKGNFKINGVQFQVAKRVWKR